MVTFWNVMESGPLLLRLMIIMIDGSRGMGTPLPDYDKGCPKELPSWLGDWQSYEHHLLVKVGAAHLQAVHNNSSNALCNSRQFTIGPPLANWVVAVCTSQPILGCPHFPYHHHFFLYMIYVEQIGGTRLHAKN